MNEQQRMLRQLSSYKFAAWEPVSYTHLDVYKRQTVGSAMV